MEIKYSNSEIEAIIGEHLRDTFPSYMQGKRIVVSKYIGDVSIDICDEEPEKPEAEEFVRGAE